MASSTSLKSKAYMVEKTVTTGVASGTIVGPLVGANTMVIAAGIEFLASPGTDDTSATVAVGDGTTANLAAVSMQGKDAGVNLGGVVPSYVSTNDSIDAVMAVGGTGLVAVQARIWAVIVDCNANTKDAAEVSRDALA